MSSSNLDLPLIPQETTEECFNFNQLPSVVQERFFEIATTSQAVKLRQTCSYYSRLAEKYHGKYPTDRLEIRELQPGCPIHFNQFRYINDRVEYIANPLYETFEVAFLHEINIKKELAFKDVSLKVINEVLDYISYSNVKSLEIRCNITWRNLKKLKTDKLTNFVFYGEIIGGATFEDFLGFLDNIEHVYAHINMDLPANDDIIFMNWMKKQKKSKKIQIIVKQTPPHPMKIFNSHSIS